MQPAAKVLMIAIPLLFPAFFARAATKTDCDDCLSQMKAGLRAMAGRSNGVDFKADLRHAQGIVMLATTKGSLGLGYQGGHGVLMLKSQKSSHWGPPIFLTSTRISLGLQIGYHKSFGMLLLGHGRSMPDWLEGGVKFGGEARATLAGFDAGLGGVPLKAQSSSSAATVSGLHFGLAVDGGSLEIDRDATVFYYDLTADPLEILLGHRRVTPSPAGTDLMCALEDLSK
jgi:lipid-binding SYLF domain-containing protein